MLPLDIAVLALLVGALVCSIVELGLVAYAVWWIRQPFTADVYDIYGDIAVQTYQYSVPGRVAFLLFCSIWSMFVSALMIFRIATNKARHMNEKTLGIWTFVLNAITTIFWLAGFAAYAAYFGGFAATDIPGAILAFSIIPWLIFLTLLVLNFLTGFGTLRSDRPGYSPIFMNSHGTGPRMGPSYTAAPAQGPGYQQNSYPQNSYPQNSYQQTGYQGAGYQQESSYQPAQGVSATNNPPYAPAPGATHVPVETRYVPESYAPAPGVTHTFGNEPKYEG